MQTLRIPLLFFSFILFIIPQSFSQDAGEISQALAKTWYAINVGEPDGGEMFPTSRKEVLTFNEDGSMTIQADRGMELSGTWEYLGESKSIKAAVSGQGIESVAELGIRELTESKLVLVSPEKATEYSTSPPDPNAPPIRKAPLVVNSVSTLEVDKWTGLHPFNKKVIIAADGSEEKVESIGVVVLLIMNGKKNLRINDDGLTTDIEVSGGSEIAGEKHYGFVTDDPELSGEVVFRSDGSFYVYRDQDQSVVQYIKE